MKTTCYRLFLLSLTIFILTLSVRAQKPILSNASAKKITKIPLFFEKTYLHLDREYYASGEDIWFQAYLVNGISNQRMSTSNNLYVELITPASTIMDREVVKLQEGIGNGDFKLPDTLTAGIYRIRAYTNWMLNYGNLFVFEKEINIKSFKSVKTVAKRIKADSTKVDIRFFPEGGALIEDVMATVGLKAVDESGKGCRISGKIMSSDGETAGAFESTHLGMGSFHFQPARGKTYYAKGIAGNKMFRVNLPGALSMGFSVQVTDVDTATLMITISTNQATLDKYKGKDVILVGQSKGRTWFNNSAEIDDLMTTMEIPKRLFPAGIARLTLYDLSMRPQSERLVYMDSKQPVSLTFSTDKQTYLPRDSVTLTIRMDSLRNPVKAHLSVSVVDADQVPRDAGSIQSYLNLESEIRGNIEKPWQYFDTSNVYRARQLDLLLLTQGWRNFLWHRLADTTIRIRKMMEAGFTISGKLMQNKSETPIANQEVSMLCIGAKRNGMLITKTDSMGHFYFDGVAFDGTRKLLITAKKPLDSKRKQKKMYKQNVGWFRMDSIYALPIPVDIEVYPTTTAGKDSFMSEASVRRHAMQKFHLSDTIQLVDVEIKAKRKKDEEDLLEHTGIAGPADFDFRITKDDYYMMGITEYLLKNLPGAELRPPYNRIFIRMTGGLNDVVGLRRPGFILDGMMLYSKLMNNSYIYNPGKISITAIMRRLASDSTRKDVYNAVTSLNTTDKAAFIDNLNQNYQNAYDNYYNNVQTPDWNNDQVDDVEEAKEDMVYNLTMGQIDRIIVSRAPDDEIVNPQNPRIPVGGYIVSIYTNREGFYNRNADAMVSKKIQGYYVSRGFYAPKYNPQEPQIVKPDLRTTIHWAPNITLNDKGEARVVFYNPDQITKVRISVEGLTNSGAPVATMGEYLIKR